MKLLSALYMLPGRIMLWWAFQNPSGGFEGVAKTGRNYRSPLFTFLTSTAFWFTAAVLISEHSDGFDFGSSSSGVGFVKPGAHQSAPVSPPRPTTPAVSNAPAPARSSSSSSSSNSTNSSPDSACEKAKKAAAAATTLDELELAKAKVEALC